MPKRCWELPGEGKRRLSYEQLGEVFVLREERERCPGRLGAVPGDLRHCCACTRVMAAADTRSHQAAASLRRRRGAWASPVSGVMFPVGFPVPEGWWGPGTPCGPAGSGPCSRYTSCSSPRHPGFGAGATCQPRRCRVSLPWGWRGAGGEASRCQLPRGRGWSGAGAAGGVRSGLSSASRAGAVPAGSAPGPALGGGSGRLAQPCCLVTGLGRF